MSVSYFDLIDASTLHDLEIIAVTLVCVGIGIALAILYGKG